MKKPSILHLFKAEEMLAMRLAVMHNLYFYNQLTARIREALDAGTFAEFRSRYSERLAQRTEQIRPRIAPANPYFKTVCSLFLLCNLLVVR